MDGSGKQHLGLKNQGNGIEKLKSLMYRPKTLYGNGKCGYYGGEENHQ